MFRVRWAREKGYLQIEDPFTHEWHEVAVDALPREEKIATWGGDRPWRFRTRAWLVQLATAAKRQKR